MLMKRRQPTPLPCLFDLNWFSVVMAQAVFVVLVIFMMLLPPHHGVVADLPVAYHPVAMRHANQWDAMIVGITREGKVFFDSNPVLPHTLPRLICNRVGEGAERKIYVNADRFARYGIVRSVLADTRATGIENISFLVRQSQPKAATTVVISLPTDRLPPNR